MEKWQKIYTIMQLSARFKENVHFTEESLYLYSMAAIEFLYNRRKNVFSQTECLTDMTLEV